MPAVAGPDARRGRGRRREERLSADDWVGKALALLRSEGVGAVKITRLCTEFGVTKGSFYWHFTDINGLMEAIADRWCSETTAAHDALSTLEQLPPAERLDRMTARLMEDGSLRVERTLREWAAAHARVAEAVAASDRHVFDLVHQALLDLGHDAVQARLRAGILVFAGIGFAQGQRALPRPSPEDVQGMFAILLDLPQDTRSPGRRMA